MRVIRCEGFGDSRMCGGVFYVGENEENEERVVNGFVIKNVWSSDEVS